MRFAASKWGIPALLSLLVVFVYANSFPGTFILDDLLIVEKNALLQHPDLATIFRSDYWHGVENSGLFRPLTILSLALNRFLLGEAPFGFHLVNVLLHAAVTVLLWRALLVWDLPPLAAVVAALLFAVHPIHADVVNIVVGRSELLVAFFLLLGFILARRQALGAGILVCLCFLLALLSKEHAITFLLLLPLWNLFHAGSVQVMKERWPLYAGMLAVAVAWLLWRKFGVINPLPPFPLSEAAAPLAYVDGVTRVLTALQHQWLYFAKLLWPTGLQAVYSVADLPSFIPSVLSPAGLGVLLGTVAALVLLVIGLRQLSPLALFALLYLVAFLPTSNLLFPIGVTMAERLAYFPSLWFCAATGVLAAALIGKPRLQRWAWALLLSYLFGLGGVTLWRNRDFASDVHLWSAEVVENPRDFLGWESLARSLTEAGRYEEADGAYRWMLEYAPDYPGGLRSRTSFFLMQGAFAQALPTATRAFALSQAKGDPIAMAFDGLDLAEVHLGLGECEKALAYLDGPTRPLRNLRAIGTRSATLACLDRHADVVTELAGVDPGLLTPNLRYQFGLSLFRLGRLAEARLQLEEAVKVEGDAGVWNLLGVVRAQQSDWKNAIAAFSRAVALQPKDVEYQKNLRRAQGEGVRGD